MNFIQLVRVLAIGPLELDTRKWPVNHSEWLPPVVRLVDAIAVQAWRLPCTTRYACRSASRQLAGSPDLLPREFDDVYCGVFATAVFPLFAYISGVVLIEHV